MDYIEKRRSKGKQGGGGPTPGPKPPPPAPPPAASPPAIENGDKKKAPEGHGILPPKLAPYISSHAIAVEETSIGKKPAWGKEHMKTDIMFTSTSQMSLDAFKPMERVALNASGTFQKTVSSYYNSPVYVKTDYNKFLPPKGSGKSDRQVTMSVGGYEFAVCTTYTEVTRADLIDAMENKGMAIGQLVRQFELMPKYRLLAAGLDEKHPEHFIWRVYTLSVDGAFVFYIHEKIRRDCFDLEIDPEAAVPGGAGGYVVAPNVTYMDLPEGFTKLERILLVANANVERIVGSYYNKDTVVHVMQNYRREPCVFERRTAMLLNGEEFMLATGTLFLSDAKYETYMLDNYKAGLGEIFTQMKVQPTFKLRDAGRTPHSFWRQYTLTCPALTVQITESFNMDIFSLDDSAAAAGTHYSFRYSSDNAAAMVVKAFESDKQATAPLLKAMRAVQLSSRSHAK